MENRALLRDCCEQMGVSLGEKETEQFMTYLSLLLEWNEKMNLTAITDNRGKSKNRSGSRRHLPRRDCKSRNRQRSWSVFRIGEKDPASETVHGNFAQQKKKRSPDEIQKRSAGILQ